MASPFIIRPATIRDITRITEVNQAGRPDDPTFDYLCRYRHEYPDDNFFFWMQRLKGSLFDPRRRLIVAVQPKSQGVDVQEDRGRAVETIVAYALWERNRPGGGGLVEMVMGFLRGDKFTQLHRILTLLENRSISHHYPRRDMDPNRLATFSTIISQIHSEYWEKRYPNNWHLELLVTHPDYRRRGAGTLLTRWGVEQGCDVGVEGSPMGTSLYEKLGFVLQERRKVQVEGDEAFIWVNVMVRENDGGDFYDAEKGLG